MGAQGVLPLVSRFSRLLAVHLWQVDRELNRLAITQVEDDVIYQKVKRQEDLKQWKIDNKVRPACLALSGWHSAHPASHSAVCGSNFSTGASAQ